MRLALMVALALLVLSSSAGAEKPASTSSVRQGMLESSNFNPVNGAVNLIALHRHADMLEKALSVFHNDFNRAAVQDLARA